MGEGSSFQEGASLLLLSANWQSHNNPGNFRVFPVFSAPPDSPFVRNGKSRGMGRQIAGDAEAIVRILEFWRDAGTGGAAGDFDVMAPGSAAGGFAEAA